MIDSVLLRLMRKSEDLSAKVDRLRVGVQSRDRRRMIRDLRRQIFVLRQQIDARHAALANRPEVTREY